MRCLGSVSHYYSWDKHMVEHAKFERKHQNIFLLSFYLTRHRDNKRPVSSSIGDAQENQNYETQRGLSCHNTLLPQLNSLSFLDTSGLFGLSARILSNVELTVFLQISGFYNQFVVTDWDIGHSQTAKNRRTISFQDVYSAWFSDNSLSTLKLLTTRFTWFQLPIILPSKYSSND